MIICQSFYMITIRIILRVLFRIFFMAISPSFYMIVYVVSTGSYPCSFQDGIRDPFRIMSRMRGLALPVTARRNAEAGPGGRSQGAPRRGGGSVSRTRKK
jgi:hypothetical protein